MSCAHCTKQLSKVEQSVSVDVYRLRRVCDATDDKERLMNLSTERLSWSRTSFVFPESRSTSGDERYPSFGAIKTSGNN